MSPAHHDADASHRAEFPPSGAALSVSEERINLRVEGTLGFDCWKAIVAARQLALEKQLPLRVEVDGCNDANLAGIGSLLVAIDRLGGIEFVGCTEQSRYWFSNLGVCRGCTSNAAGCRQRVQ